MDFFSFGPRTTTVVKVNKKHETVVSRGIQHDTNAVGSRGSSFLRAQSGLEEDKSRTLPHFVRTTAVQYTLYGQWE